MKLFLLFVFILSFTRSFSQQHAIDSLWRRIKTTEIDSQKVNNLNKLFFYFNLHNNDSAQKIAEQALQLSFKIKYPLGKVSAYNNLGTVHYYKGNNSKALINYLAAVKTIENERGNDSKSLIYKKQLSSTFNNIGTIYQRQKLYVQAENYFNKSIAIDKSIGDKKGLAHCYNNIGTIKQENSQYDEAILNYEIALKLKQEIHDTLGIPSTLINMGIIRMNQNKFKESEAYFEKALLKARKIKNKQDEALALINLGDMFYLKKQYSTAVNYYEKGIKVSKSQNYHQFLSYAYNSLSAAYYKMKNFEKAYDQYQLFVNTKDSLYNSENTKVLHELEAKYENEVKEKEIKLLKTQKEIQDLDLNKKKLLIYIFIGGFLLLASFALVLLKNNALKKKTNLKLDVKNQKIELAYTIIEQKQKEIVDSINYAKRIQYTLLAHEEFLQSNLEDHFILYKPKDIVSGDFYWATKQNNKFYLAVCDSTGHGVPGAFMSLLNIGFFSEAINEKGIYKPNEVLNYVRQRLVNAISKEEQKDGFDGILLCIDKDNDTVTYAAANNNPILIKDNGLIILPKDKMPVGIGEKQDPFTLFDIEHPKGSFLYLLTDGYADQFGGKKGKKFMYKQLEAILLDNHHLSLEKQSEILNTHFEEWRGGLEQVDDVCIMGIQL